jgi:hypothetical protein
MAVHFNHTIVWAADSKASATFLAEAPGITGPTPLGPFQVVATGNGVIRGSGSQDGVHLPTPRGN